MRSTIAPPISVATMSKYSIPAGTTSAVEVNAKYWFVTPPVTNMWCDHTAIDSAANAMIEATNALYPNHRLCALTAIASAAAPRYGKNITYTTGWPKNQNRSW